MVFRQNCKESICFAVNEHWMPLIPLLPIFHSFNREFFNETLTDGLKPLVSLKWSDGRLRKTAGFYRRIAQGRIPKHCEIVLSRPLLQNLPRSAIESTLCHEMIHAWVDLILGLEEGHGPNFYEKMNLINSSQSDFKVSVRHNFPVQPTLYKWWAICPSCSIRYPYKRIVRGVACKKCCNTYHHGNWHRSCLLVYEPFLQRE